MPFKDFSHLDLLPLARRLWRDRLPSRALKYLEENILGAPRTIDEVPGYEIPYLYFDYLRTGDAGPLKGVFYHNAMDIVALAALMNHMASILDAPFGGQVQHGLDFVSLAKLYEDLDRREEAARLYERGLEAGLGEADFGAAVQRLSALHRRRGDLEAAATLWQKAAAQGHVYAHVELAKYFEHSRRDFLKLSNGRKVLRNWLVCWIFPAMNIVTGWKNWNIGKKGCRRSLSSNIWMPASRLEKELHTCFFSKNLLPTNGELEKK